MKLKTYIDNTYYVAFNSYFIICLILSMQVIILKSNILYFSLGVVFLVITLILMYFFYSRTYVFNKKDLTIKLGFIKKKVYYKDILKSYITSNYHISYATSKKRIALKLKNRKKEIYISPEKIDEALLKIINNTGGK